MKAWDVDAKDYDDEVVIGRTVGDDSQTEGSLEQMQKLFHDRYNQLRKIVAKNYGFTNTKRVTDITDNRSRWSIASPIISGICGTTAFPSCLSLSTRLGTP